MSTEIELKLDFNHEELLRFRNWCHLRHITQGSIKRACMQAIYFDTPNRDLLKHKAALRIRREFGDLVQTYKQSLSSDVIQKRIELNFPVSTCDVDLSLFKENGSCKDLFKWVGDSALKKMFQTKIWRTVRMLKIDGSIIELAIDSGAVFTENKEAKVCEVELELIDGDPNVLLKTASQWKEIFQFNIGGPSKAQRGYELVS